ncbi:MAG TPA: glycosyl transferase [Cyanobacteria bacterium UBA8553]|nr:glycosyl transferase [Cyanobacteria bacterium UBA8553]HAJ60081.1 glycosyl transferase [Cyanobacteria bacterium UBA8543]
MPKVSIITPLYNKAAYITETIQSVLSQTYSDWEMLVVDNGSTDDSWEKAQAFQGPRIRLLQSPKQGPGAARNYGLDFAQGQWIQFLDADDLLEPEHLEQQLAAADENPEAEIIACYWQEFTDENPTQRILKSPMGIGQPLQVLRDKAIAFAPWAVHAALVKRSLFSPDYYWPEQLDRYLAEDIAFWFKLVSQSTVAYGKSQGALYRMETPQCRNQNINLEKRFQGIHAAIELNQQCLQTRNQSYTPEQCENLMTAYSALYISARKQKLVSVESSTLFTASKWLKEYFLVAKKPKPSMLVRRLIGLKLFYSLLNRRLVSIKIMQ